MQLLTQLLDISWLKNMTRLSVNINKYALLRNSRGGNQPDLIQIAKDCERFGAEGITVHPRQDERHIRYSDVRPVQEIVTTEFNIEGFPDKRFLEMVLDVQPHQCTLVPDASNQLTSDHGWNTIAEKEFLTETIGKLKEKGIRVSLFMDADEKAVEGAKTVNADRIELYTGPFAPTMPPTTRHPGRARARPGIFACLGLVRAPDAHFLWRCRLTLRARERGAIGARRALRGTEHVIDTLNSVSIYGDHALAMAQNGFQVGLRVYFK